MPRATGPAPRIGGRHSGRPRAVPQPNHQSRPEDPGWRGSSRAVRFSPPLVVGIVAQALFVGLAIGVNVVVATALVLAAAAALGRLAGRPPDPLDGWLPDRRRPRRRRHRGPVRRHADVPRRRDGGDARRRVRRRVRRGRGDPPIDARDRRAWARWCCCGSRSGSSGSARPPGDRGRTGRDGRSRRPPVASSAASRSRCPCCSSSVCCSPRPTRSSPRSRGTSSTGSSTSASCRSGPASRSSSRGSWPDCSRSRPGSARSGSLPTCTRRRARRGRSAADAIAGRDGGDPAPAPAAAATQRLGTVEAAHDPRRGRRPVRAVRRAPGRLPVRRARHDGRRRHHVRDYARRGFFELVAVDVSRRLRRRRARRGRRRGGPGAWWPRRRARRADRDRPRLGRVRLALYQDAYGWTELRLYVAATIVWLAIGIAAAAVLLVARPDALARPRDGGIGVAVLVVDERPSGRSASSPRRTSARASTRRSCRPTAGGDRPDLRWRLGDDAVPVARGGAAGARRSGPGAALGRPATRAGPTSDRPEHAGPAAWNLGRERARGVARRSLR